ncbi:hypothetical protein NE686_05955 [Tissierella carlieri]|uniref:Uncharacterized protein n=1 Tax=Tissierella carlieri TaxID=689904 RepID=A0ABT1S824_9FIRM|nr:hypothetical protein [Tissierella carlieri]MCQ4922617.1 hypothetical protein [Tissierella carlieri]
MKSLNDIIWNEDIDLEEKNGDIQFGDDPNLEQSCSGLTRSCRDIKYSYNMFLNC